MSDAACSGGVEPGPAGGSRASGAPTCADSERAPRGLLLVLSALALALTLGQILGALGGIPHVQDEQAYLLQARVFAGGARVAPASPLAPWLAMEFQELSPAWYGVFPPGWPLVLALGVLVGAPWLVNPLLAAALPWLCWRASRPSLGSEGATAATTVLALSPGVLLLGGSWMSHTLTLALALGGLVGLSGGARGAALAGLCTGALAVTRPWDAVLLGGPACVFVAAQTARGAWSARRAALFTAGPVLAVLALAWDNGRLTGSPWLFPVEAYFADGADWGERWPAGCNRIGLGPGHGCASYMAKSGYTLEMAWRAFRESALAFDRLLLGVPGMGLLALLGLGPLRRRAPWLLVPMVLVPLGYGLYWYHGISYGPRFWHGVYLTAAPALGLALLRVGARFGLGPRWVLGVALLGLALRWPGLQRELSQAYWCVDDDLAPALEARGVREGVVLLDDRGQARRFWPETKLDGMLCGPGLSAGAGLARNDPWGEAPLTWARLPEDEALTALLATAEGPVWRVLRDLSTGAVWLSRWDRATSAWTSPEPVGAAPGPR